LGGGKRKIRTRKRGSRLGVSRQVRAFTSAQYDMCSRVYVSGGGSQVSRAVNAYQQLVATSRASRDWDVGQIRGEQEGLIRIQGTVPRSLWLS
jgi:hypothetical protein